MLLIAAALASILAVDMLSVKLVHKFEGVDASMFGKPALETDPDKSGTTTFTIHAEAKHSSLSGTVVLVWIEPGMSAASPVAKTCNRPACLVDQPDKVVIQNLFKEALNEALLENTAGLGHYRVVRCGEKESETESWLDLERKVDLAMDTRHYYMLANCCTNGRPSSLTLFGLGISRWDSALSRAKFGPMGSKKKASGLVRVRHLCDEKPEELETTYFITQLPVIRDELVAPPAKKQGMY